MISKQVGIDSKVRGFTLIEVMLVVAIVGILAAVAIPQYQQMVLRARQAEAPTNVIGLATEEAAYYVLHENLIDLPMNPSGGPDRALQDFETTIPEWREFSWRPDGKVRCAYSVDTFYPLGGPNAPWGIAHAFCDLDGDGLMAQWHVDIDPERLGGDLRHLTLHADPLNAGRY